MIRLIRITTYLIGLCLFLLTQNKIVLPATLITIWWFSESVKGLQLLRRENVTAKCIGLMTGPFIWTRKILGNAEYEVVLNEVVIAKTNNAELTELLKLDSMSVWSLVIEQAITFIKVILDSLRSWLSAIGGAMFALLLIIYKIDKNYAQEIIHALSSAATPAEAEKYFFIALTAILSMAFYQIPNVCKIKFENELLKKLKQPCRGDLQLKNI